MSTRAPSSRRRSIARVAVLEHPHRTSGDYVRIFIGTAGFILAISLAYAVNTAFKNDPTVFASMALFVVIAAGAALEFVDRGRKHP
jgi:hypothetical protein